MATKIEPLIAVMDLEAMPEDGNRYEVIEGELFVSCAPGLTPSASFYEYFVPYQEIPGDLSGRPGIRNSRPHPN